MNKDIKKKDDSTGENSKNQGSGGFNEGSKQDSSVNEGTKVSDYEKRTGHSPSPGKKKGIKKG